MLLRAHQHAYIHLTNFLHTQANSHGYSHLLAYCIICSVCFFRCLIIRATSATYFLFYLLALQLHVEVQQSMQQLAAIQSELRGNINFMSPGSGLPGPSDMPKTLQLPILNVSLDESCEPQSQLSFASKCFMLRINFIQSHALLQLDDSATKLYHTHRYTLLHLPTMLKKYPKAQTAPFSSMQVPF